MSSNAFVTSTATSPRRLVASALGLVLATSAAHAADVTVPPPKGDKDAKSAETLESVRVQSTVVNSSSPKFTAPLLDTPRSVTVIPQEIIQQSASMSLQDVLRTVPGITFGAGEGGNPNGDRPIIRGFDSESSIFVDGVRSSGSQQREIFDIEQVEVIKGPSSAYTGRGSVGGSINLVSKAPKAENFVSGTVGLGTDSYKRGTADWNQLIGSDSAFRLNVMAHDADVPGRNGPDQSRWGIAPSITFGLHADTSVTLSYYHLQSDDTPDSGIPYNNPNNAPNRSGSPIHVPRGTYYGLLDRDFQKQKNDIGQILVKHDFGDGWQLRNTTVYARSTNDYIWTQPDDSQGNFLVNGGIWRRNNNRISDTTNVTNQTDLTGTFETGSVKHTLAVGVEISNEKTNRTSYLVDPAKNAADTHNSGSIVNGACTSKYGIGAPSNYWCAPVINPNPHDPWTGAIVGGQNPARITTNTRSAWAFDTMELNEMWSLNLGTRFDSFETKSTALTTTTNVTTVAKNDSNFWNYQAGVVFKPAANGSIYASYGTSSNPPGVDAGDGADGIAVTNSALKPESSRNLEVGTKWDVLEQRVSLTGAIFRTEKTNARVATGGRGSTQINAGKQRVDGIEIGASGNITEQWNVFAGYTYLNSKLIQPAPADIASKGNQFPNTPKNSFTLWTSYAITPRLTVGGGAYAMDKVYGNTANTKWVPGYTRFDLMASYVVNRNVTLQLNVQNLTNKYYFDKAYAAHYANVAPGRVGILSANFKF
ncbi:catecholate siderophore receptor [Luteibacter rhizovicinus]|uniref:Catecholate siderophore receptor n=1 Tax=Luteibacter rhizovicinus TaxID=242606 RepID=A0A4R3YH09_9GAMM|nr:TonB-dependent receptor [Luteibacter rhizovicinus]TCV91450.1 catecholate siderophore receptor [Luteibacter rhizovicinus]